VICCVDVDYRADGVVSACVGFAAWSSATAELELVARSAAAPAEYRPGAFYERELPYLLAVLARMPAPLDAVIVDAYVDLGADHLGLGAHLHAALARHATRPTPVVGVAKTAFAGAPSVPVLRGDSAKPLHVTARGISAERAAAFVREMHGEHRVPTLLRLVDALARGHAR
jgi:deoxyribonuclease V